MNKLNRFLLAEDPRNGGALAIIHTIDPMAIIVAIEGHSQHTQPFRQYAYVNSDGIEELWTLYAHHLFTTNMNAFDDEVSRQMVDKLLNRAWHWYKSYMEWEDGNIDMQDEASLN